LLGHAGRMSFSEYQISVLQDENYSKDGGNG
jgi:hypothetical protein